jgi:hypothetical protein
LPVYISAYQKVSRASRAHGREEGKLAELNRRGLLVVMDVVLIAGIWPDSGEFRAKVRDEIS